MGTAASFAEETTDPDELTKRRMRIPSFRMKVPFAGVVLCMYL